MKFSDTTVRIYGDVALVKAWWISATERLRTFWTITWTSCG
jgi:hypothetical protein